jgi:hypothetical protein
MRNVISGLFVPALLLSGFLAAAQVPSPSGAAVVADGSSESCARLAQLNLTNATITSATAIQRGAFSGPAAAYTGTDMSAIYKILPPFCRVIVQAHPTADSDIGIEVWMPLTGWNGRLEGFGNGGFAGVIDYSALGSLMQGYASAATDAGHTGSPIDATWALGHPEKIEDFGHRGIHEMTRVAKAVVEQFYGSAAKHAYFFGCSDGGREALMEAQRYPADYDGILAGAPANNWTNLLTMAVVDTQALTATPTAFIPQAKIPTIAKAVLAACDAKDGLPDGIINDPRQCHFDPATIECKGDADTNDCLTAPQVAALKAIYAGLHDAKGRSIFPGYLPGAEEGPGGWGLWITGPAPARSLMAMFGTGYYSNMVYGKGWDYQTFTLDAGLRDARQKTAEALDAVNPDLSPFYSRGGKLILYHGWNDPAIPALSTVNYYKAVVAKAGPARADSFVRLYMVPGMQHCGGGPGATVLEHFTAKGPDENSNVDLALENWVEKGIAPGTIIAVKTAGEHPMGAVILSRPLCPYPQTAKYKGAGDPKSAESFTCAAPAK